MRKGEEDELEKCREIIKKMKSATNRQRNISNDVKTGLKELEEAIDVITYYRYSWMAAERQGSRSSVQNEQETSAVAANNVELHVEKNAETPRESGSKRIASSPAESEAIKRQKEGEESQPWTLVQPRRPAKPKRKRRRRSRRRKLKPDALLIKTAEGKTYAEVLGTPKHLLWERLVLCENWSQKSL